MKPKKEEEKQKKEVEKPKKKRRKFARTFMDKKPENTPEPDNDPLVLVRDINMNVRSKDVHHKFLKFGVIIRV